MRCPDTCLGMLDVFPHDGRRAAALGLLALVS